MINDEHLLTGEVRWERSPNHSGLLHDEVPDTIVIHYTGGSTMEGAIHTLTNPLSQASAHLVIDRDGSTTQLVPFNIIAWHAGRSEHEATGRKQLNNFSIGIELVNAGPLQKISDAEYMSWFSKKYPSDEVIQASHKNEGVERYWQIFSQAQIERTLEICRLLKEKYPIQYLLGHDEISPGRKIDPGPAFPIERFRNKVLQLDRVDGLNTLSDSAEVNAYYLNIRKGPAFQFDVVSSPLEKGVKVIVIDRNGKWAKVKVLETSLEGWVNGKYLK